MSLPENMLNQKEIFMTFIVMWESFFQFAKNAAGYKFSSTHDG
jgi:hypothetical protein